MNCTELARLIDPYLDGELDAITCVNVEEHVAGCPACQKKMEQRQTLMEAVSDEAPRFTASPFLATRIRAALRAEDPNAQVMAGKPAWWHFIAPGWIFSGLGSALAAIALTLFVTTGSQFRELAQEAVTDHVRSQQQVSHLMDVVSTDQHTVKPWFDGKLDFSPQVIDLKASGYPLVGGRLDRLDHHDVAAIVYQRRKHYINLFVWPSDKSALGDKSYEQDGYHVLGWTKNGMNYLAVSEIGAGELKEFAGMIKDEIVPPLE